MYVGQASHIKKDKNEMANEKQLKHVHDKISVPAVNHHTLELLKLKADAINDNLIIHKKNCIAFRIPAGEDDDVTFAEFEFAVEFYNDKGLPFNLYLEPFGGFEVTPKKFNKVDHMGPIEDGDENVLLCRSNAEDRPDASLGYLSWNYLENTLTFIPPLPGAKMGKNVMIPSCNPHWSKERIAEFEKTGE